MSIRILIVPFARLATNTIREKQLMDILRNLTIAALLLLLVGCASHKVVETPSLGFDLTAQDKQIVENGVSLMARPIHRQAELETYFGTDILKYGILPVQLNIQNKDHQGALSFTTESLSLINPDGARAPLLSVDQVMEKAKKSYWRTAGWTVAFGIFGAIPSAINVTNTNKEMRADYESRIMKDGILQQGSVTEGTAFFSVPPKLDSLNGWKLSMVLKGSNGNEDLILSQALNGTILARTDPEKTQAVADY
jgi:hypothetical protein